MVINLSSQIKHWGSTFGNQKWTWGDTFSLGPHLLYHDRSLCTEERKVWWPWACAVQEFEQSSYFCSISFAIWSDKVVIFPRPSHRPVLITCCMQKWWVKAWECLSWEWHPRYTEGRGRTLTKTTNIRLFSCNVYPSTEVSKWKTCCLLKNFRAKCVLSVGGSSPSVDLSWHWCHSRDKCSQPSLLFCILQVIKNWTVGRLVKCSAFSCWLLEHHLVSTLLAIGE